MRSNIYIKLLLLLTVSVLVFHACIIVKLIPYNFAWGGRIKTDSEMYMFETISIFVNLLFIGIILIKGSYLSLKINPKLVDAMLWTFFVLFSFNTIGNIFAETAFEKSLSVLTLVYALLIWKLVKHTRVDSTSN